MSTHGALILSFIITLIMFYIIMKWELPDGKLCYIDYGDVIKDESAHFELMVKRNEKWELIK